MRTDVFSPTRLWLLLLDHVDCIEHFLLPLYSRI
jgi:hypothetical protein